jgi:hypothetical protein
MAVTATATAAMGMGMGTLAMGMGMGIGMAVMGMAMAMAVTVMGMVTVITDTRMGTMGIGITVIGTLAKAAGGTVTGMAMASVPAGCGLPLATFGPATENVFRGA